MKALLLRLVPAASACLLFLPVLRAQDYRDLMLVRNRPVNAKSLLQFRLGAGGTLAEDEDVNAGREDSITAIGSVFYHEQTGTRKPYEMDVFAGRGGFYVGVKDKVFSGKQNQGRVELYARPFGFYREGYFDRDQFVPTGRYEGQTYGMRLGIGRELDRGSRFELSAFGEMLRFSEHDKTEIDYAIPDNHQRYGLRLNVEQSNLQLNRVTGLPEQGYLASVAVTREQNNSDARFGVVGGFESELASGFWRGEAHIEFFHKSGDVGVWEVELDGSISSDEDRIYNYEAEKPIGQLWGDLTVGYRMQLGDSLYVTPFGHAQYTRTVDDNGTNAQNDFWFGGGLSLAFSFGEGMALVADYSYLNNPYRAPVAWRDDQYGEHVFFVGLDVTFGGRR